MNRDANQRHDATPIHLLKRWSTGAWLQIASTVVMGVWWCPAWAAERAPAGRGTNVVEIQSVAVHGKPVSLHFGPRLNLGLFPDGINFGFGPGANATRAPIRLRYKLEGHDTGWNRDEGTMFLAIRFYNRAGDQIGQKLFKASGETTGWTGDLRGSPLEHRRETFMVPPDAARLMVVISSAGPPATQGIYVVDHLIVSRVGSNDDPEVLLRPSFARQPADGSTNQTPSGWVRDGNHPSMARILELGPEPARKVLAILDEDSTCHAEWHSAIERSPRVGPGDQIVVDWNEMYSIGLGDIRQAGYPSLPAGNYRFVVEEVNTMGVPTGVQASLALYVPSPFWREWWFFAGSGLLCIAMVVVSTRYSIGQRMRREMLRLENQNALERERVRIAHDIHDDLGARVTQISLLSAMAQKDTTLPEQARVEFDRISRMSRELVAALYETVWAVNPENDNLDSLGNYLCQMAAQMCEPARLRCRFHVEELPEGVRVSSQIRHNITMAAKEAVNNAIKHGAASELTISSSFTGNLLTISVQDDGRGFQARPETSGNGLANMVKRLKDIGGTCSIESTPGAGTKVTLRLMISRLNWEGKK